MNVTPDRFENFVATSTQFLSENDRLIRQNPKKDPEIFKIKMTSIFYEVEQVYSSFLKEPNLI